MKKTTKQVRIALNLQNYDTPGLVSLLRSIILGLTGNAHFTVAEIAKLLVSLADMGTQATDLETTHNSRKITNTKALTALEADQATTVMNTINSTKGFVETLANQKAAGDPAVAVEIITSVGFSVTKEFVKHQRKFEVVKTEKTIAHLRTKSAGSRASYMWQWTANTLSPVWSFPIVTIGVELTITNLRSGTNYGFRYAAVLPVIPGKPTVAAGSEQPVWSDMITAVIP